MKNGFLMVAIATLFFASCQKDTGSNNATSGANTGNTQKKNKISTFGTYDASTGYTHWSGSEIRNSWYTINNTVFANYVGATPPSSIVENLGTPTESGSEYAFGAQHDVFYLHLNNYGNGNTGDSNIKCRYEFKFPDYIVPDDDNLQSTFSQKVHIGGMFKVDNMPNVVVNQAVLMQALQCNNKPQIQVSANPKFNEVYILVQGQDSYDQTPQGKWMWDNFNSSTGPQTKITLPYSDWGNPFKIDLDIVFSQDPTVGNVYAKLTPSPGPLSTETGNYNGQTFFVVNMPGYDTRIYNPGDIEGVIHGTNSLHEGVSWSVGDYADWKNRDEYESVVWVYDIWGSGLSETNHLNNAFNLKQQPNSF